MHSEELLLRSPEERLRLLDCVFLRFDELLAGHPGALKVETVGCVYLIAANGACALPAPCTPLWAFVGFSCG